MAFKWYRRAFGAPLYSPNSYTEVGFSPPYCPGTGKICAIYAENDELGLPIIDSILEDQMKLALANGQDETRVLLRHND